MLKIMKISHAESHAEFSFSTATENHGKFMEFQISPEKLNILFHF